jgi:predicted metal-dependent phosphoesterase TrpH
MMDKVKADLHIHTMTSDGSEKLDTILTQARKNGITHVAFSDHDTTKDAAEHQNIAKAYGVTAIKAVEMSAYHKQTGRKVHILGYQYQKDEEIEKIGSITLEKRNQNCLDQIEILRKLGYHIDLAELRRLTGDCIYKQHILDYLVQTGQSEAIFGKIYQTIFKNGGPCDFDITYPEAADVVEAILRAGGKPVLAHPGQQQNFDILPELYEAGLKGIEKNHPSNSPEDREKIALLARKYGLFITGGSDFHGRYEKIDRQIGCEFVTDLNWI